MWNCLNLAVRFMIDIPTMTWSLLWIAWIFGILIPTMSCLNICYELNSLIVELLESLLWSWSLIFLIRNCLNSKIFAMLPAMLSLPWSLLEFLICYDPCYAVMVLIPTWIPCLLWSLLCHHYLDHMSSHWIPHCFPSYVITSLLWSWSHVISWLDLDSYYHMSLYHYTPATTCHMQIAWYPYTCMIYKCMISLLFASLLSLLLLLGLLLLLF